MTPHFSKKPFIGPNGWFKHDLFCVFLNLLTSTDFLQVTQELLEPIATRWTDLTLLQSDLFGVHLLHANNSGVPNEWKHLPANIRISEEEHAVVSKKRKRALAAIRASATKAQLKAHAAHATHGSGSSHRRRGGSKARRRTYGFL